MSSFMDNKRAIEQDMEEFSKKAKMYSEKLEEAKAKKQKYEELEKFIDVMASKSCTICSEDLIDCVENIGEGLSSYVCNCTFQRVVHTKCWERNFKCACGIVAISNKPFSDDVSDSTKEKVEKAYSSSEKVYDRANKIREQIDDVMDYENHFEDINDLKVLIEACPGISSRIIRSVGKVLSDSKRIRDSVTKIDSFLIGVVAHNEKCQNHLQDIGMVNIDDSGSDTESTFSA